MNYLHLKEQKFGIKEKTFTSERVDLTRHVSETPRSTSEEIEDTFRDEADHKEKIRNGQVHHQHVGRGPQLGVAAEDPQDAHISEYRHTSCPKQ